MIWYYVVNLIFLMTEGSRNPILLFLARVAYFVTSWITLVWFYSDGTFFLFNGQEESASELWGGVVLTGISFSISLALIKYALNSSRKKTIDYSIIVASFLFYCLALIGS